LLKDVCCFKCIYLGKITGLIYYYSEYENKKIITIVAIYTNNDYQNKGYATELLLELKK